MGFPEDDGDHTDPGPAFPWDVLLDDIRDFLNPNDQGDDMDGNTYIRQAGDVSIAGIPGGTLNKPLSWWLSATYSHICAQDGVLKTVAAAVKSIDGMDDQVLAEVDAARQQLDDLKAELLHHADADAGPTG